MSTFEEILQRRHLEVNGNSIAGKGKNEEVKSSAIRHEEIPNRQRTRPSPVCVACPTLKSKRPLFVFFETVVYAFDAAIA
jgi:hypothetical protein